MNRRINKILIEFLIAISIGSALFGCKKQQKETVEMPIEKTKLSKTEFAKLERYISITTGLPQDQIKYDEKTQEFFVAGTTFKEKLSLMKKYYDEANDYKFKYEKQN